MRGKHLFDILNFADDDIIERTSGAFIKKKSPRALIILVAACLTLAICAAAVLVPMMIKPNETNPPNLSDTDKISSSTTQAAESEIDEGPGVFYTLDDFKTYVKTGSRDLSDYDKEKPPFHIPYRSVDEKEILYIDDFFKYDTDLLDDINVINFFRSSSTEYVFNSGLCISVDKANYMSTQHGKELLQKLEEQSKQYISLEELKKNPNNEETPNTVHKVGDAYLVYNIYYSFNAERDFKLCLVDIYTEQFHIQVYAENNLLSDTNTFYDIINNPINKSISPLFEESEEREKALEKLLTEFNKK